MRTLPFLILLPALAFARPVEQFAEDTDQDATLTLAILDQAITGDARSHCNVRIQVGGEAVPFEAGDTVSIRVYENDFAGDDVIWRTEFEIEAEELAAQAVDRVFDCTSEFGEDGFGDLEIYANARVDKAGCGFFCLLDRPSTTDIDVAMIDDDDAEEDDGANGARDKPLGVTPDRVGRDQDWFVVELVDPGRVGFTVQHRPSAGRLEAVIFDAEGEPVGRGVSEGDGTRIDAGPLDPGRYTIRVQPRDGADFNFYDAELRVDTERCVPGAVQSRPCESCGVQRAVCLEDGRWGPPGECADKGECEPGAIRQADCGDCGLATETCDDACVWLPGPCMNEGICGPGQEESRACDGGAGRQVRICGRECAWSDFSPCSPNACADGERRECYDGPPGTAGVGLCRLGSQRCVNGVWAPCDGSVTPEEENCGDGDDNDCNGDTDFDDPACEPPAVAGEPCRDDDDCGGTFTCIDPATNPRFRGGYCGRTGCEPGACPEGSVCGVVFGQRYCLLPCRGDADCRAQYVCADAMSGEAVCIPRCLRDEECTDPEWPVCDRETSLCVPEQMFLPEDAGRADAALVDAFLPRDAAPPTSGGGGGGGDEGCRSAPGGVAWPWALLLIALRRRRR